MNPRQATRQVTRLVMAFGLLVALAGAAKVRPDVATMTLGASGATLAIRQSYEAGWPRAHRTFLLTGANGRKQRLALKDAGGEDRGENFSLNLFRRTGTDARHPYLMDGQYLLISKMDCVQFDPVAVTAQLCPARPSCEPVEGGARVKGARYLGRFDWMNGYDPPDGAFRLRFRYLPAEDAVEGGACPTA